MDKKLSDSEWKEAMEKAEDKLLALSKLQPKLIRKDFITIYMDNKPFQVRTFDIGDKTTKKTLVLVHGYTGASVMFYQMLYTLSQQYRIVMFDHGSWGMNTRLKECSGYESQEAADWWIQEWITKVFEKLDLPQKFLLCGHSLGGWMCSLYASMFPDRVDGLFLISPAGVQPYVANSYDPYSLRDPNDLSKERISKEDTDKMIYLDDKKRHWLAKLSALPPNQLNKMMKLQATTDGMLGNSHSQEEVDALSEYLGTGYQRLSVVDIVQRMQFKYGWYALHPL